MRLSMATPVASQRIDYICSYGPGIRSGCAEGKMIRRVFGLLAARVRPVSSRVCPHPPLGGRALHGLRARSRFSISSSPTRTTKARLPGFVLGFVPGKPEKRY